MHLMRISLALAGVLAWSGAAMGAPALLMTPEQQAVHVLNRVAFGPRPGDIERVSKMGVQNYLDQQLRPASLPYPAALSERLAALRTPNRKAGDVVGDFVELQKQVREEDEGARQRRRAAVNAITVETAEARLARAIDSPRQLEEVMVDFWYNHFNVFAGKGIDRALVASYERDAIRPNALGNFHDLLKATAHHPAMLYYLDNFQSTAEGYRAGGKNASAKGKASGLNENYARELMELHTLGVDGGYSQKDVTELARMLTGWTYDQRALIRSNQTFRFDAARHDTGVKHWLGRDVAAAGVAEGDMALDVLASHPATARHISYKLAQYFVQDEPSAALVALMARVYLDADGDIGSVLRVLFASGEFMAPASAGAKFKTPYQFVVSAARASATPVRNVAPLLATMAQLGMPLYGCQTPDGYKNTEQAWLNPDALSRRISFASALAAGKLPLASAPLATAATSAPAMGEMMAAPPVAVPVPVPASAPPQAILALDAVRLQATLGAAISPRTRSAVAATAEPLRAAMLLGSPDFMQR
ncbi:DUF1800 domain-containing protein [Massilia sp. PWRC2]|uniref:DUF1800 domain-containing protein n=1 Tax=Massilia sp. PWRC2 TaxID=2804626 RepID=UPI003CE6F1DB